MLFSYRWINPTVSPHTLNATKIHHVISVQINQPNSTPTLTEFPRYLLYHITGWGYGKWALHAVCTNIISTLQLTVVSDILGGPCYWHIWDASVKGMNLLHLKGMHQWKGCICFIWRETAGHLPLIYRTRSLCMVDGLWWLVRERSKMRMQNQFLCCLMQVISSRWDERSAFLSWWSK